MPAFIVTILEASNKPFLPFCMSKCVFRALITFHKNKKNHS